MLWGTHRLFSSLAEKGILKAYFIDQGQESFCKKAISEINPDLIWIETPSNPLLQAVDIQEISKEAKACNALVTVDNTFLSPSLQNPLKLGADIVMHSTTKYINGHSDIIGGALITNNHEILLKLKFWANTLGITGSPFDSYLTLRGLRTLSIRMEKHEKNATAIITFALLSTSLYPTRSNIKINPSAATGSMRPNTPQIFVCIIISSMRFLFVNLSKRFPFARIT